NFFVFREVHQFETYRLMIASGGVVVVVVVGFGVGVSALGLSATATAAFTTTPLCCPLTLA
ncbi:hypothetical protein ScalyP_jg5553, partial [Parmales sp. scaly parma]